VPAPYWGICAIAWQQRLAPVPHGHWKVTTLVAGLRCSGITAPCVFDGAINGERFRAHVEQMLAPTLRRDDIVLLDNLSSHKAAGVVEAITAQGAQLRYLPPYSPDLNPIVCHRASRVRSAARLRDRRSPSGGLRMLLCRMLLCRLSAVDEQPVFDGGRRR
jgi:transposase